MTKIYFIDLSLYNKDCTIPKTFHSPVKKKESAILWHILYELLTRKYKIVNPHVAYTNKGKPYLLNEKIYFNISHSFNMGAIIISDSECSIDIEKIKPRSDLEEIAKKILNEEDYQKFVIDYSFFYKIWTIKEAYYKYQGIDLIRNNKYNIPAIYDVYKIKDYHGDDYFASYIPSDKEVEVLRYEA